MASKSKYLRRSGELEELHIRHSQLETERESEGQEHSDPGNSEGSSSSIGSLQRAVARPGLARPQDMLAVSRTYGNQAVMRLVEQAQLEKQTASNASALQRLLVENTKNTTGVIQRIGGGGNQNVDQKKREIRAQIKEAKKERRKLMGGKQAGNLLRQLLTLPVRVIDQLSIVDLHVKDTVNFFKHKLKTRKKRFQEGIGNMDGGKQDKGDATRMLGRTGLYGYLHGVRSHKVRKGNVDAESLPVLGSKYNPLKALGGINKEKIEKIDKKITGLKIQLASLDDTDDMSAFNTITSEEHNREY